MLCPYKERQDDHRNAQLEQVSPNSPKEPTETPLNPLESPFSETEATLRAAADSPTHRGRNDPPSGEWG